MEILKIIRNPSELDQLQEYLKDKEYVAFDTETTGTDKESLIIGFSICAEPDVGYYVITRYWDKDTQQLIDLPINEVVRPLLESLLQKKLIMQNGPFDCFMVKNNYGIELIGSLHTDTLVLGHLLNENRSNGLKERGVELFGDDATKEQAEMKASVSDNGGILTKAKYELYKADPDLIAKYGAKDAILTYKVFLHDVEVLVEQGLDTFFYDEECMPLLKGPTYDLNTTGLKVDSKELQKLKSELQAEMMEQKAFIYSEITPHVKLKYPGTTPKNTFNISASKQLAWLLFNVLGNEFLTLTEAGRKLCHELEMKIPYAPADKRSFIHYCETNKGKIYAPARYNHKNKKMSKPKKIEDYWYYLACGKDSLNKYSDKYKWAKILLEYAKNTKILTTYVEGIQERAKYNIIRPSFLQHGTTSGRYSSKNPNFQNLPRKDKRVKKCIVARDGNVFVGADYSQLEPRVFASFSGDERLQACFTKGEDFYSVIGTEVFDKFDTSLIKDDENSFANKYPDLRDISKAIALSATYGTTAFKMATLIKRDTKESQDIIDSYFEKFPKVKQLMLDSHDLIKKDGYVVNLFGRPRRMPRAKTIDKIYGVTEHKKLPYEIRKMLNLSTNHRIQSTAASIMNRSAISVHNSVRKMAKVDSRWNLVKIVMQVHDELILEGPEALGDDIAYILKYCMENTVTLPGVALITDPKIAKNLADLK